MTMLPYSATTPISVGRVGLRSRDADRLSAFYREVLGLQELRRTGAVVALGTDERELLEIEQSDALQPDDPRSAGLFHTAFLLPERADLARWARHAMARRVAIDGASDHLVSEAMYLADPEGNGIEIYADRSSDHWRDETGAARLATNRLDFDSLFSTLDDDAPAWDGAPAGTVVGHVHLRVGEVDAAEGWWNRHGLDTVTHYGGQAVFLSSGGYHHHIGANIWQSRGAGPRRPDRTGLSFVEMRSALSNDEAVAQDPWGTEIRILPKAA